MPNIIENYIVINGPKEDLDLFRKAGLGYDEDSIWFHPGDLPADDLPADEDSFGFDLRWESKGDPITFRTQTAWSYPVEALEKASAEWPTLAFRVKYVGAVSDGEYRDYLYQGGQKIEDRDVADIVEFVSEARGRDWPIPEDEKERLRVGWQQQEVDRKKFEEETTLETMALGVAGLVVGLGLTIKKKPSAGPLG